MDREGVDSRTSQQVRETRVLIVIAALVAIGLGWAVVRNDIGGTRPKSAPSSSAASPSSTTMCLPRVVETGYTVSGPDLYYGLIAENSCPEIAIRNKLAVAAVDAEGRTITDDSDLASLPFIRPGQRIGAAGSIYLGKATKIVQLTVEFINSQAAPNSCFTEWPTTVTVDDITFSEPRDYGRRTVTGRIRSDPIHATLCGPRISLILRDQAGRIIYGKSGFPEGSLASIDVTPPSGTDFARTEIYVAAGVPLMTCPS